MTLAINFLILIFTNSLGTLDTITLSHANGYTDPNSPGKYETL